MGSTIITRQAVYLELLLMECLCLTPILLIRGLLKIETVKTNTQLRLRSLFIEREKCKIFRNDGTMIFYESFSLNLVHDSKIVVLSCQKVLLVLSSSHMIATQQD